MRCTNCGAERVPGAKFCQECGTPVGSSCPGCGVAVGPAAKFCHECGERLDGAAVAPGAEAPTAGPTPMARATSGGAERRLVTVLFADLVGFTTLA